MDNTYWNDNGQYQAEYKRLIELMPASGGSTVVAGELIRAVSRLGYDLYNNGMGNNTSGAVNMLLELGAIDAEVHATIYPFTRGRLYAGNYTGDRVQLAIESAVDSTIEHILANPALETEPNPHDMFDWADEEEMFCEECGDSDDDVHWGCWGHTCRDCEDEIDRAEEEEEEERERLEEEDSMRLEEEDSRREWEEDSMREWKEEDDA
jgi:hypothetical protein